eukprot:367080-Rhodomonas_salina.2
MAWVGRFSGCPFWTGRPVFIWLAVVCSYKIWGRFSEDFRKAKETCFRAGTWFAKNLGVV